MCLDQGESVMWILLVVSYIADYDEYKATKFNTYNTNQQCEINRVVLETTFTEGEKAVCVYE